MNINRRWKNILNSPPKQQAVLKFQTRKKIPASCLTCSPEKHVNFLHNRKGKKGEINQMIDREFEKTKIACMKLSSKLVVLIIR